MWWRVGQRTAVCVSGVSADQRQTTTAGTRYPPFLPHPFPFQCLLREGAEARGHRTLAYPHPPPPPPAAAAAAAAAAATTRTDLPGLHVFDRVGEAFLDEEVEGVHVRL